MSTFDLINGGQFIGDTASFNNESILGVIDIIGNILKIIPGHKHVDFEKEMFNIMPQMIVNFAYGCRVDSGYCLLERCLRHCFDSKSEPIITKKISFLQTNEGNIAIILRNNVPASMKDSIYDVSICFTKDQLLACKCDCASGAKYEENVACVHNLPLLYQFFMLLHDGLAENILIELSQRWDNDLEAMAEEDFTNVKKKYTSNDFSK